MVPEDRRVDPFLERTVSQVRHRPDPVVVHGLVRAEHERVPLPCEDVDRVDRMRASVDRVRLDDRHRVLIDAEYEVHVARHRDKPETVPPAVGDGDDGEVGGEGCVRAAPAVDKGSISTSSVKTYS